MILIDVHRIGSSARFERLRFIDWKDVLQLGGSPYLAQLLLGLLLVHLYVVEVGRVSVSWCTTGALAIERVWDLAGISHHVRL